MSNGRRGSSMPRLVKPLAAWRSRPLASALGVALLLAPAGSSQFTLVPWTPDLDGTTGGLSYEADWMSISSDWTTAAGSLISFTSVAPADGLVSVNYQFFPLDGACFVSSVVFLKDSQAITLASCLSGTTHFEYAVTAGTVYGFGLLTNQAGWPSYVSLLGFDFEPAAGDPWSDLQHALPGVGGAPQLLGTSLAYPHFPFILDLSAAAPDARVALVVGLGAIDAPFKGGVLVPSVDLLLAGQTEPTGTLQLATLWPNDVPSGLELYFQAWIVDAAGPAGFAASNALKLVVP